MWRIGREPVADMAMLNAKDRQAAVPHPNCSLNGQQGLAALYKNGPIKNATSDTASTAVILPFGLPKFQRHSVAFADGEIFRFIDVALGEGGRE